MYPSKLDVDMQPPSTGFPVNPSGTGQYYPSTPANFQIQAQAPGQYYPPAPANFQIQAQAPGPWSTGLCHCCDDVGNCCITCWCPCITFGQIAEIVDRGSTSCGSSGALYTLIMLLTGCQCFYSCFYRSKMRSQYSLLEKPCGDCLLHCCCESCALCQEYRELKRRGYDMNIGWHANLDRQAGGVTMPPGVPGGMSR